MGRHLPAARTEAPGALPAADLQHVRARHPEDEADADPHRLLIVSQENDRMALSGRKRLVEEGAWLETGGGGDVWRMGTDVTTTQTWCRNVGCHVTPCGVTLHPAYRTTLEEDQIRHQGGL